MEDFKSILLDLIKCQNTRQLQVQERMEEKWQKQLLFQQENIEKLFLQTQKEKSRKIAWWFGWVSLFNGILTLLGYLMPKPFS